MEIICHFFVEGQAGRRVVYVTDCMNTPQSTRRCVLGFTPVELSSVLDNNNYFSLRVNIFHIYYIIICANYLLNLIDR